MIFGYTWFVLYACCGVVIVLISDGEIRANKPIYPVGIRALMFVLWPVYVALVTFLVICYSCNIWIKKLND